MTPALTVDDHNDSKTLNAIPQRLRRTLDCIFAPQSVAVVGTTETPGSVGRTVMTNPRNPFDGPLYPVNPRRRSMLGGFAPRRFTQHAKEKLLRQL